MITQDPRSRRPVQIVSVVGPDDDTTDDLEKLRKDFCAWEDTHEHELREIERGYTPKEVQE